MYQKLSYSEHFEEIGISFYYPTALGKVQIMQKIKQKFPVILYNYADNWLFWTIIQCISVTQDLSQTTSLFAELFHYIGNVYKIEAFGI